MNATQQQVTEIIPHGDVIEGIEGGLAKLKQHAQSIEVRDQSGYIAACQLALDARAYMKDVKAKLSPGIESAKGHLQKLQNHMKAYLAPAQEIDEIASRKAEDWKRAEREAAAREQERIRLENEAKARQRAEEERRVAELIAREQRIAREKELAEMRKAGEIKAREAERLRKQAEEQERKARELAARQAEESAKAVPEIRVQANVPKVAGIKARVNWKFRITDATRIPREFLVADEVKIGQFVREHKHAGEVIPGVEAYSEDSI